MATRKTSKPKFTMPLMERRRKQLYADGFLKWESIALSRNSINSPSMIELRKERRKVQDIFILAEGARQLSGKRYRTYSKEYDKHIHDMYVKYNWMDANGKPNPFARLREIADRNIDLNPDWREQYTGLKRTALKKERHDYATIAKKTRMRNTEIQAKWDEINDAKRQERERRW